MWWWVLIWTILVVVAGVYLVARLWGLWGQVKELTAETERASRTLAALEAEVDRLGEAPPQAIAVFQDPRDLRRERERTRASLRQERRTRQAARRPVWARNVD